MLEEVRNEVLALYELALENHTPPNPGLFGAALGILDEILDDRHEFQMAVFGVYSATEMDEYQKAALQFWVAPVKDDRTGRWMSSVQDLRQRARLAVKEWREQVGKMIDGLFEWEVER